MSDPKGLPETGVREIEKELVTDFRERMSYGSYLELDQLLSAQSPVSKPVHHDELLFIIQHQTSELWLKLMLHELREARRLIAADSLDSALKAVARVKKIQHVLTEQWSVLATLTPSEYAEFRSYLGNSSGFQSYQYRAIEFLLGNKNAAMLRVFESDLTAYALVAEELHAPTLYDEALAFLARAGHAVPESVLNRDVTKPYAFTEELVPVFVNIYQHYRDYWPEYHLSEDLVDVEDNFQAWRFRHLRVVQRTIGWKKGTGGSSGVGFLQKALDLTFFPEIFAARTEIEDIPVSRDRT